MSPHRSTRRLRSRLPALALALAACAVGSSVHARTAHADPPPVVDPGQRADQLNAQGKALAEQGKLEEARLKLDEAWRLKRAYDIAGNLALVEEMTGHPDLALEHVEFALGTFPAGGKPEARAGLEKRKAKLRELVVRVVITTAPPPGAKTVVNGRAVTLETNVYAMPGEVVVSVDHEGDEPFSKTVQGVAGGEAAVTVELRPKKGAPIVPTPEPRPMWPAILGFSLAGAGLVVGVSTLVAAETSTLDGCATPAACTDISDRANALGSASVWAFVGTGVAAGASIGLLAWSLGGPSKKPSSSETTLLLLPNLGGASLRGTF